jgi:hypothetical protein
MRCAQRPALCRHGAAAAGRRVCRRREGSSRNLSPRATCMRVRRPILRVALAVAGRCTSTCILALRSLRGPRVCTQAGNLKYNYVRVQILQTCNDHARTRTLLAVLLAVYLCTVASHLQRARQFSKLRIGYPFWDPGNFSPQYLPFLVTSF